MFSSKNEVDDIDNELSTLILNTYTKTEIDTQLTDYTSITYLQDNYMTTLSISKTLMNNYASLTLIGDSVYDKLYIDNQFSLKADASNTVTTNYLTTNYTNTVDLISVITIKLKLVICYYPIVLALMSIITFTLKLKLILY